MQKFHFSYYALYCILLCSIFMATIEISDSFSKQTKQYKTGRDENAFVEGRLTADGWQLIWRQNWFREMKIPSCQPPVFHSVYVPRRQNGDENAFMKPFSSLQFNFNKILATYFYPVPCTLYPVSCTGTGWYRVIAIVIAIAILHSCWPCTLYPVPWTMYMYPKGTGYRQIFFLHVGCRSAFNEGFFIMPSLL